MNILDASILVALEAHDGSKNKHDGELYLLHLARVFINVRDAGGTEVQQAIAWLHDSIEDTQLTIKDLRNKLDILADNIVVVNQVVKGVDSITKIKGESNEDYYYRLTLPGNEDARFVKLRGDLVDNFRRNHKIKDEDTKARMAKKYSLGMDILS